MSDIMSMYRDKLYKALLGNIEALGTEDSLAREVLEMVAELDLNAIEPIIEEMLVKAAEKPRRVN